MWTFIMKKKVVQKGASKKPILALSQLEEKELILDTKTIKKLDEIVAKNGGSKSGLNRSDIVAHLLIEKGRNGFKFSQDDNEAIKEKFTLPKSAWDIAKKSSDKSGNVELSEVIKELVKSTST